jgi:glutamate/tyrosine decarboxylase-like PLP-dependent enzyme
MVNMKNEEENLDPKNWEAMRVLAHEMVDDALDYLQHIRQRPVWQPIPQEVKEFLAQPVPRKPEGEAQAYEDFKRYVLPHPLGNIHPRFWGWVIGTGIPYAVLADMLASTMNPNLAGGDHGANYVERQVVDWCKEMMGYPDDSSGILVSGGSMANFVGLTVARNVMAGYDIREEGVEAAPTHMTVYASTEVHSSNYKAIDLLGLGKRWMRQVPVNEKFQIDIQALEKAIAQDKAKGYKPFCIIGTAGTVNTGAFDDLDALADICEREEMWFHIDGAFGALATLADRFQEQVSGLDRADSLAFDLHKWMYMPIEAACVLIRKFDDHVKSFAVSADYLEHIPRGAAAGEHTWFGDLGLQLTRGFRALKIWMTLKAYGLDKFGRQIEQNAAQARYLAELVEKAPELELLADVPLNIVCFRYVNSNMDDEMLNEVNMEILVRLHERGLAVPSYTRIQGKFALRAAITNHRSRREDFDFLVEKVVDIAQEIIDA